MPGIGAHTALPALRGEFRRQETSPGSAPGSARGSAPTASRDRISSRRPAAPRGRPAVRGAQPPPPAERSAPTAASPPGLGVPERCICYPPGRPRSPTPCKNQTRGNRYASFKPSALECVSSRTGRWPSGGPCCPVPCLCRAVPRGSGTETGAGVSGGTGRAGTRQHPPSSP